MLNDSKDIQESTIPRSAGAWGKYKHTGIAEMRPHIPGEDMINVSVAKTDISEVVKANETGEPQGGMIARNPENHKDQWYVAAKYFVDNFEPAASQPPSDKRMEKDFKEWLAEEKLNLRLAPRSLMFEAWKSAVATYSVKDIEAVG